MDILKKPRVNFPESDQYWQEVRDILKKQFPLTKRAARGIANLLNFLNFFNQCYDHHQKNLAPIEFLDCFENVLPYHFSYTTQPGKFSHIIVHKGELENISSDFLTTVHNTFYIFFANPVFIVYTQDIQKSGVTFEKVHSSIEIPSINKQKSKTVDQIALVTANQFGNLGDDAVTWASYNLLEEVFPKAKINIYTPPVKKRDIFAADLLVLGGGGLFYDGCIFNAMNYTRYIAWAKEAEIYSCGLGIGTQGIKTTIGVRLYKEILALCDFISVRDLRDFEILKYELGIKTPIHLTQDMAFSLNCKPVECVKQIPKKDKQILFVSLLDSNFLLSSQKMENYRSTTQDILKNWHQKFDIWCLVQSEDDVKMYLEYVNEERLLRVPFNDIDQVFDLYKQADLVLTSRFHGFIFSLINQIPVIATGSKDGKIHRLIKNSLLSMQESYIPINNFNKESVINKVDLFHQSPQKFLVDPRQLDECIVNANINKTLLEYYFKSNLSRKWSSVFIWQGRTLEYPRKGPNLLAERVVETPIVFDWLDSQSSAGSVLEVGNVLEHYVDENHRQYSILKNRVIVDKFEQGEEVLNCDLFDLSTDKQYDTIFSISTVEHIGQGIEWQGHYGETQERDKYAPLKAIARIYDLLNPNGKAFISVPWGKITDFGWLIQFGPKYLELLHSHFGISKQSVECYAMKKISMLPEGDRSIQIWEQSDPDKLSFVEFNSPWQYANAVAFITLTKFGDRNFQPTSINNDKIQFAPPVIIGGIFQNDFNIKAQIISENRLLVQESGIVFYGPYKTVKAGKYSLQCSFLSELELTLDACINEGNTILFKQQLLNGECDVEFSVVEDSKIEIRLYNNSTKGIIEIKNLNLIYISSI